jgi:glycosyltransferase involved in cell wall biosynthesis
VLDQITPLIITYNEAPNIRRTLEKLLWARRIVVVDSGSTDQTTEILRDYPQVEAIEHPFLDFASQCNFGLTQVATRWVLSLDADYELSDALVSELATLMPAAGAAGYQAGFVYRVHGRALRGALYPPRTVLYRREGAVYRREGHGHRVSVAGDVLPLGGVIYHDDRKPLARWLASQRRYARDEAEYLLGPQPAFGWVDRVRRMAWPAPLGVLLYVLLVKGCIWNGWAGWYYAVQRTLTEALVAFEVIRGRVAGSGAARSRAGRETR